MQYAAVVTIAKKGAAQEHHDHTAFVKYVK